MSNSTNGSNKKYYIYYFLPILACSYFALQQYSFLDSNLGTTLSNATKSITTTSGTGSTDVVLTASSSTSTIRTVGNINQKEGHFDDHHDDMNDPNDDIGDAAAGHDDEPRQSNDLHQHDQQQQQQQHYVTGSFANCIADAAGNDRNKEQSDTRPIQLPSYTIQTTKAWMSDNTNSSSSSSSHRSDTQKNAVTSSSREDFTGTILISCQNISFRAPTASFLSMNIKNKNDHPLQIITGVLSSAVGISSKQKRESIRKTWAQSQHQQQPKNMNDVMGANRVKNAHTTAASTTNTATTVYFLLAGPWENVQEEYETYQDIIWIDQEEVYNGEKSVLTMKTYSFFQITYAIIQEYGIYVTHLFKTDDDSYVHLPALYREIQFGLGIHHDPSPSSSSLPPIPSIPKANITHDYFGQCQLKYPQVHREQEYKWPIRNETYPEPWFPRYCQGAGFGISLKFLNCAAGKGHISNIRFMPFEDVAVGMLAERCGVDPVRPVTARVKVFRYQSDEVKKRTRTGDPKKDDLVAPAACMENKIVQHRIIDEEDMEEHHKSVLDPSYCNVTKAKREGIIQEMKERGIEWFG